MIRKREMELDKDAEGEMEITWRNDRGTGTAGVGEGTCFGHEVSYGGDEGGPR